MTGSLSVCLLSTHEEGELVIKHNNTTSAINWSDKIADAIQWVAFYSDCEHEVRAVAWLSVPVTAVTLAALTLVTHLDSVLKHFDLGQIDHVVKFAGYVG
jgi:hypothetical protein